jgi:hypothetical protein
MRKCSGKDAMTKAETKMGIEHVRDMKKKKRGNKFAWMLGGGK